MGQIEIIGIDSLIFIYLWEINREFFKDAKQILMRIENNQALGVFARIGIIELLTGSKKRGRFSEAAEYKEKISNFPNLLIRDLSPNIIDIASDLRAKYSLRTPDAIHIATAIDAGAVKFITNDKSLKKVREIKIELL